MMGETETSTSVTSIDREQLHGGDPPQPAAAALSSAPDASPSALPHLDISGALEAVRLTASALSTMCERIAELEAHVQALETFGRELAAQGEQLAAELHNVGQQRDSLASDLNIGTERGRRLEALVAQHVSRAIDLERDLNAARSDLARIAETVAKAFGS